MRLGILPLGRLRLPGGTTTRWSALLAVATLPAIASIGAGCGDDTVNPKDTGDVPLFDTGTFPDVTSADTLTDATTVADSTTSPDVHDTLVPDLVPDLDPPTVVSTTPELGAENIALPLTITIVFSEPVYKPTIATQTIKLIDWLGNEVPGTPTLGADGKTVTWKPAQNNQQLASAYTIRVIGNIISDLAGNKLVNTLDFTFTTANYPDQDALRDIAAKYAPTIYSAVSDNAFPQYQVPTKFDGDGDWNLANNKNWIVTSATELVPAVYYAVTESRTHYFIDYVLYFPYVNHTTPSYSHTNTTSGTMVVVEKAHDAVLERPVASYHYWRESVREEQFAFATSESDIVGGSDSPPSWGVVAEFAQDTLFEGGREKLYVTAGDHRMCLWNWDDGATIATCEFNNTILNGDTLVFSYQGGSPTKVVKTGGTWPSDMSDVDGAPEAFGYALIPLYSSIWPRRAVTGDDGIFEPTTYKYSADADRPGGNLELSSKFIETLGADLSSYGKPVWAWKWNPAAGGGSGGGGTFLADAIEPGELALDPAYYVWERHHRSGKTNGIVDYVEASNTGFSRDYCFNGFLNIDLRKTDPKCAP
ncbi:MAG: Ig-like domain-containing protein [Myxococcota bacterium]